MGVLWFSSVRTGRCWYSAEGPHLKLSPSCGVGKDRYTVPAPSLLPIHCNAVQQKPLVETLFLRTVQTCSSCDVPNLSCCVGNTFKRWRKWDWLSACKRIPQFVLLHTNSLKVYLHCTGGKTDNVFHITADEPPVNVKKFVHIILYCDIFHTRPNRPWSPPSFLYNGYRVFPKGKAATVWRSPPNSSSTEVKERVELYLYSPLGRTGQF